MKTRLCTSLSLLLLQVGARAQLLVPVAQERTVAGSAYVDDNVTFLWDVDSDAATDFGPYVASAAASVKHNYADGSGGGAQDSQILDSSFVAYGTMACDAQASMTPWAAFVTGETVSALDFHVGVKVQYHIAGNLTAFDDGIVTVQLRDSADTPIAGSFNPGAGSLDIDLTGVLEPGLYQVAYKTFAVIDTDNTLAGSGFAFGEYDLSLELTPLAGNYCVAAPNSVGPGAQLSLSGSQNVSDNHLRVEASGALPNGFGLVFYGSSQMQAPFGDGFRCAGGMTHRVQPAVQADASGFVSKSIDFTAAPAAAGAGQIVPGSTWNFQLWYRDPMGPGGNGFNLSDGLWIAFCP